MPISSVYPEPRFLLFVQEKKQSGKKQRGTLRGVTFETLFKKTKRQKTTRTLMWGARVLKNCELLTFPILVRHCFKFQVSLCFSTKCIIFVIFQVSLSSKKAKLENTKRLHVSGLYLGFATNAKFETVSNQNWKSCSQ